jgi:hypothetical protein
MPRSNGGDLIAAVDVCGRPALGARLVTLVVGYSAAALALAFLTMSSIPLRL